MTDQQMPASDGRPPKIATWLVRVCAPVGQREPILGDLAEEFVRRGGARSAAWWYWVQAVSSSGSLVRHRFSASGWGHDAGAAALGAGVVVGLMALMFTGGIGEAWMAASPPMQAALWAAFYGVPFLGGGLFVGFTAPRIWVGVSGMVLVSMVTLMSLVSGPWLGVGSLTLSLGSASLAGLLASLGRPRSEAPRWWGSR